MHRYNWIRGKEDKQDYKYTLLKSYQQFETPPAASLQQFCSPVKNQDVTGSCSSFSATGMAEFLELKELRETATGILVFDPNHFVPMSELFVYYNERVIEGTILEDSGAQIKDAIQVMANKGLCKEDTWPYDETKVFTEPKQEAYAEGLLHKISTYYKLNSLEDIKHCIASGYPVMFGFEVPEVFESPEVAHTGEVPEPSPTDNYVGGHATLIVGYNDVTKKLLVRNSWGSSWALSGYFHLPYSYVTTGLASDFWTARR
jgi:C1A family cysteine protease